MAGNLYCDIYLGWQASCIAMGGFEARSKARVVREQKSRGADMLSWIRVFGSFPLG